MIQVVVSTSALYTEGPGIHPQWNRLLGYVFWTSLVAQMIKNLPATWETRVQSLSQKDFPEKGMATHSSILAWRIPWILRTQEPVSGQRSLVGYSP